MDGMSSESAGADGPTPFPGIASLRFRYEFRKYQRLILASLEDDLAAHDPDRRFHVVSPPGSGKTILGIELIRRSEAPAVVFTPTVTIQRQWRDRVGLFLPDSSDLDPFVSMDAHRLAPINVFTYQLIAAPAEADGILRDTAREEWIESLILESQAEDESAARARVDAMEKNNREAYRRELARRSQNLKRRLIREPSVDIGRFLHPNARRLIDSLVEAGVRTVVLDECHHLLDYWAVVLSYLIARIDQPIVVGLTATLPSPDDGFEYENYTGLLGEVDYEVPVPAVVKEGDLAPYRDLVYFVEPSPEEHSYLRDAQAAFERATAAVCDDPRWATWLAEVRFSVGDTTEERWVHALSQDTILAVAALRHMFESEIPVPEGLDIPPEAFDPPDLDDRLTLLERYGLGELKLSPDEADHQRLADLRKALKPFGISLTEAGMRQALSPGDLILSYSSSKAQAAADILTRESASLGLDLRAVLVTDFERTGASGKASDAAYPSGSARQVFLDLISHVDGNRLDPVLVTGKTLWIDADHGQPLINYFNDYLKSKKLHAKCSARPNGHPGVLEVVGDGQAWGSGTYVAMVTAAFETGVIRCLVGTRGLFAEGWDTLTLNTLIDLTTASTATTAQQLRGRSIRLDPAWPRKLAHNWDVICVEPSYARGDRDFARLRRRHGRVWGVIPPTTAIPSEHHGRVVKGLTHVDPALVAGSLGRSLGLDEYQASTMRSLAAIGHREASYALWDVGAEYENFTYSVGRLSSPDLRIRTVYTMTETLRAMLAKFRITLIVTFIVLLMNSFRMFAAAGWMPDGLPSLAVVMGALLGLSFAINSVQAWRIARKVLREQPVDTILLDVGRAVLGALKEMGKVSPRLQPEYVRVAEQLDLSYEVMLDYASPEDTDTFTRAFREVFAPIGRQRYLVSRNEARLPALWLQPMWIVLRVLFRPKDGYPPAYHGVPSVFAASKRGAECFARHWRKHVGSGELLFTHGPGGWRLLMKARGQSRPRVRDMAFEVWR
ncbi:MAG: DEAD/DEAH box helicase family protein [Demequinaceae bacterium]|nr:DEAD/DEAH box helicase family protein [Demequinaceae bacterium]